MRNRCLPCYLIIRNVCILLTALAGTLFVVADIHSAAESQTQRAETMQRLFIFQIVTRLEQKN